MSSLNTPISKSIVKIRNHKRIENQKKQSLINLVLQESLSTR